jgi:hypothetical protein
LSLALPKKPVRRSKGPAIATGFAEASTYIIHEQLSNIHDGPAGGQIIQETSICILFRQGNK